LTIYNDAWGTPLDFATAFTTGFLSETIVNWALLPAFQSYRIRRTSPSAQHQDLMRTITHLERALIEQSLSAGSGNPPAGASEKPAVT
jgi:hypothetical protein